MLSTKHEVKVVGYMYWMQLFCKFFFAFLWKWRSNFKKKGKIEQCRYPTILTEQAWENEDLLLAKKITFSCWTNMGRGQDTPILPTQVANVQSTYRIYFILPTCTLSHTIIIYIFPHFNEISTLQNYTSRDSKQRKFWNNLGRTLI